MKRFNLISILILFFTFFGVQFIIAATQVADGVWEDSGNHYVIFNESWKSYNIQGDGNERLNKTYYFNYPSKQLTFYAETVGAIKTYPLNIISCNQSDIKQIDNKDKFNYTINDQNCRTLKFSVTENKTFVRNLTEIKLQMAPHIIMKTESVDFMFNLSNESADTKKDVKFHSFLTAGTLKYSIVNKDNDEPNKYFTLHDTKKVESNTFSAIDNTTYNFKVSFNPSDTIDGYYYARIKISDGISTEYVNLSGYKYNLNLQWDQDLSKELTVDEPFTLIADTYGDNGNGPIAKEISVTYTWSPDDALSIIYPEKPEEAYPIITPKKSYESVTITAIKNGNTYYNSSNTIEKTIKIKPADQSLIWEDFELTTADKNITITDVLCQSTKYNLLNQLDETITYSSSKPDVVEINDNTLTVHKYGEEVTITANQDGKDRYINAASATKTITTKIGTIRFDNNEGKGDKHWNDPNNWLPVSELNKQRNVEPSAMVNAVIAAEAEISNDANYGYDEINNLTIEANGKLTITATSALKANKVTNTVAENLILKASAEGNATLIYADGTPKATVEMYSKAENGILDHTDGKNPEWQYVGIAVNGTTTSTFSNAWLLKWTEAESADNGDPWSEAPLNANTILIPWAGYSISQPEAATYSTKGSLLRGDHQYKLSYTPSDDPDCGFNLLANSYTAPIDIAQLEPDSFKGADACIILYNTGTYADWESHQANLGENPGQLTVIPVATGEAAGLTTTIASMQAFFVKANENNATFTVKYNDAVAGASNHNNQMRAPRAHEEFNVLKIMIEGENSRDRLFLLENEATSKAYDNGYEARKIFDAPRGHQMYATCQYGYASIDCSESFVGQTIGLKGDNEGEMLTISFDTDRLYDYQSLYLYDKVTGKYVNILSNEKYTFFGIKGANDNRFSIVTNPDDKAQTPPFVIIDNELAFDKAQINSDNANIYIYDTSGRLLMTDKVNPGENYRIPDMPEGIYLVSMNGYTTKIVRK